MARGARGLSPRTQQISLRADVVVAAEDVEVEDDRTTEAAHGTRVEIRQAP